MEHRIGINNRRKQFTGIGRDYLCDFQDGVQYQFPYPVRGGQLESTGSGFTEECSDGIVCLKPFHRAKYVVLHHGQREAGNLRREVHALAPAEVEQLLAIMISHLGSPAGSVRPVCLEETEREVRREQSIPMPVPASLREEQAHGGTCELHVYGAVGAPERPVMLGETLVAEDALMLDMGEHLTDELTPAPALWSVSVIDNQADRLVVPGLSTAADLAQQLEVHCIQQFAPLDVTIIHKTIEHVLLTTEQAA